MQVRLHCAPRLAIRSLPPTLAVPLAELCARTIVCVVTHLSPPCPVIMLHTVSGTAGRVTCPINNASLCVSCLQSATS
jgi:hypothetical protein